MTLDRTVGSGGRVRRSSSGLAAVALIGVNLVPVAGVLALGWSVGALVLLYWLENAIVGAWNAGKMVFAAGEDRDRDADAEADADADGNANAVPLRVRADNVPAVLFFAVHYGGFWLGHGVFVVVLFVAPDPTVPSAIDGWFLAAVVGLVGSHGVSFVRNFVSGGEYRTVTTDDLYLQSYRRVFALHVAIVVGAWFVDSLGAPVAGLVLLVLFKTGFDLYEHAKEHRRLGAAA